MPLDPSGAADHTGDDQAGRGDTFVVQEHHATALHWDVRLERDGVLVSWAVPKGVPLDPRANRLARQTGDHALAHALVGRDTPPGGYGGGRVSVWDSGSYELEKWRPGEVKVVLHGSRVQGRYVLFRTGGNSWMMHRMDGPPAGWTPLPRDLRPMRPTPGALPPDDDAWSYRVARSGLPVLVAVDGGRLLVTDAAGRAVTSSFPELRAMGLQLGSRQVLLHGEVAVLDGDGRPDDALLAGRTATARPGRALLRDAPVTLLAGDLLHVEGRRLLDRPYEERRAALEDLALVGPHWQVPPAFSGRTAVLADARARWLPGVQAHRRSAGYLPGQLSPDWVVASA